MTHEQDKLDILDEEPRFSEMERNPAAPFLWAWDRVGALRITGFDLERREVHFMRNVRGSCAIRNLETGEAIRPDASGEAADLTPLEWQQLEMGYWLAEMEREQMREKFGLDLGVKPSVGRIHGRRADMMLIDDPLSPHEMSEGAVEKIKSWYDGDLLAHRKAKISGPTDYSRDYLSREEMDECYGKKRNK